MGHLLPHWNWDRNLEVANRVMDGQFCLDTAPAFTVWRCCINHKSGTFYQEDHNRMMDYRGAIGWELYLVGPTYVPGQEWKLLQQGE